MITDSTELFVFSATFDKRPPLPLTHPKRPGSSALSDVVFDVAFDSDLFFSTASFSPPLTNSNSDDSREAVGCPIEVVLVDGFKGYWT